MMNVSRQPRRRLVRILSSELDDGIRECLSGFVHEVANEGISVATLIPSTVHENDLLEKAAEQRWDLAMLILNNIGARPGAGRPLGRTKKTISVSVNGSVLTRAIKRWKKETSRVVEKLLDLYASNIIELETPTP
jgi:hypothetical protein